MIAGAIISSGLETEKGNQTEFFNWLGKDLQTSQTVFFRVLQKDETVLQLNHHANITMLIATIV